MNIYKYKHLSVRFVSRVCRMEEDVKFKQRGILTISDQQALVDDKLNFNAKIEKNNKDIISNCFLYDWVKKMSDQIVRGWYCSTLKKEIHREQLLALFDGWSLRYNEKKLKDIEHNNATKEFLENERKCILKKRKDFDKIICKHLFLLKEDDVVKKI